MNGVRVLLVGMGADLAEPWIDGLRSAGAHVTQLGDGVGSLQHLGTLEPDVILVNLDLGGVLDGFDTCRAIRSHSEAIVVLVASEGHALDEVVSLAVGADHFFVTGTATDVVVARVRALVRRARGLVRPGTGNAPDGMVAPCTHQPRCAGESVPVLPRSNGHAVTSSTPPPGSADVLRSGGHSAPVRLVDGDVEIDLLAREVKVAGRVVELTRIEFDLLTTLAHEPRRVLTREQLMESVWEDPFDGSHVLDTHMSRLRCKIGTAGGGRVGYAIRGVGYRLRG
jgi:DNA-binding response OmpR family regulator